jgi:phage-related protein
MNKMRIVFYKSTRIPVRDFIDTMGKQDQAKVLACLKNIEDLGFDSPRVQFRQIRGKLWEIKIHASGGGYRFFYVSLHSDVLVLLHAYKKQSQKAPNKEIGIAEKRLLEVLKNESYYIK